MSLRVWLPLNGDLHNQGISNIQPQLMGNGVTWTTGKIGQAATFPNNCNSCIYMPGLKLQIFSWACWLKILGEGSGTSQRILSEGRDTGSIGTNIWVSKAGTTLYWSTHKKSGQATIELNRWHHVALIADDTYIKFYLNGILKSTTAYTEDSDYAQSNDAFVLGKMAYSYTSTGNYFPFNGQLNDVRIYDHALSAKEVREIYKGLVLHIKLDGGGTGNENLAAPDYGPVMLASTNPISVSESKWVLAQQTGGCTYAEVTEDNGEIYTQITRDSVAHSGWGMLYYRNVKLSALQPNTWYTVSFEVKPSVDGEINWTGIVRTNATNYLTDTSTRKVIQNKVKANEWQKIVASIKTVTDSGTLTNASSQVIYFSLSSSLWATGVVLQLRHIKLEQGLLATLWTPSDDDWQLYNKYCPYSMYPYIYDCSGYNNILADDLPFIQLVATNAAETPPRYNGAYMLAYTQQLQ